MRVQDGRAQALELRQLVRLDDLLPAAAWPAAQFARLAVLKGPRSVDFMFGLFKAAWRWCRRHGIESIVLASPPWAVPIYDFLQFRNLGSRGSFEHEYVGGVRHVSMLLPVRAEAMWRAAGHPLCRPFVDEEHSDLEYE